METKALPTAERALEALQERADPERARFVEGYFKTAPGQYGAGDRFLGIPVPVLRALAREYGALPLEEALVLLQSPLHEVRLFALLIMVRLYERGDAEQRERVHRAYRQHRAHVNNWDLVDVSAPAIVGRHIAEGWSPEGALLTDLAGSNVLWDRRIAIVATQYFIRKGQFGETLRVAELLLHDPEDLIHKAVGWMLREVGKRDRATEEEFLSRNAPVMPRTMLRYAVEKFPPELRATFLKR